MKAPIILVALVLAGFLWVNCSASEDNSINHPLGNLMQNKAQLEDIYFAVRPSGASNKSTLYRFNLTYGQLTDIGDKFTPKHDICRGECKGGDLSSRCHFDLKDATVAYDVKMSYGSAVVQEFRLYALIKEFPFGDHYNPTYITAFIVYNSRTAKYDMRQCLITDFILSAVTYPPFWNFPQFKGNDTLAVNVWEEFQHRMFTHVRLTVKKAIKEGCERGLLKKNVTCI